MIRELRIHVNQRIQISINQYNEKVNQIFTVKMPSNPCLGSTIDQARFNGKQLIRDTDLLILKK